MCNHLDHSSDPDPWLGKEHANPRDGCRYCISLSPSVLQRHLYCLRHFPFFQPRGRLPLVCKVQIAPLLGFDQHVLAFLVQIVPLDLAIERGSVDPEYRAGLFFLPPLLALIGAAVAMIIEYLPLPINDNILIPFLTGLALTIVSL